MSEGPRAAPFTGPLTGLLAGLLLVGLLAAAPSADAQVGPTGDRFGGARSADLTRVADSIVSTPPLDQLHWGILFRDAETGEDLYRTNEARKFIPASNVKLAVAVAALELLGPAHRWETALWTNGSVGADGTLHGDLVLPATGDPTLSARFHSDDRAPLDTLAVRLLRSGVRAVEGNLVVDVSRWDSLTVPGSWMLEDLGGWWGATPGAFAVAEGEVRIEVRPGRLGEPADLRAWPRALADTLLDVRITTVPPGSDTDLETWYLPGSGRLVVRGEVEAGPLDTIRISARDPVRVAADALAGALADVGIEVRGEVRVVTDPAASDADRCQFRRIGDDDLAVGDCEVIRCRDGDGPGAGCRRLRQRLAALESPPLSEVVQALLEVSQNWIAEQVLLTLGLTHLPDPVEFPEAAGAERPPAGLPADPSGEPEADRDRGPGADPIANPAADSAVEEDLPPTRRERALLIVEDVLVQRLGVDSLDLRLRDASGLSTQNLLTPRAVHRILEHGWRAPWRDVWMTALASPGEEESTLEHRLDGYERHVFAKTGTLSNVVALSGYLRRADGGWTRFSVLVNGSGLPASRVQPAVDAMVEAAAR